MGSAVEAAVYPCSGSRCRRGAIRTYLVRSVQGRLNEVPFDVCVLISRRHHRDKRPKCFLCTNLTLTAQRILNWYGARWPLEVDVHFARVQSIMIIHDLDCRVK